MPKTIAQFIILCTPGRFGTSTTGVYPKTVDDALSIARLVEPSCQCTIPGRFSLQVEVELGSPTWELVTQRIFALYGWKPWTATSFLPRDEERARKFFGVEFLRTYTMPELGHADHLLLFAASKTLLELGHCNFAGSNLIAKGPPSRKLLFGGLGGIRLPGVAPTLREAILKEDFFGMDFQPIDNSGGCFVLNSSVTIPRCELPVVNGRGLPTDPLATEEPFSGSHLDDGPFRPIELRYKCEVKAMLDGVDVARTYEVVGHHKSFLSPMLVVSQRFWRFLLRHGEEKGVFSPVRFIDESGEFLESTLKHGSEKIASGPASTGSSAGPLVVGHTKPSPAAPGGKKSPPDYTYLNAILKAAKACGQRGSRATDPLPEDWPEWYQQLARKVPVGGLCVYARVEGESLPLEAEFFTPEQYQDYLEDEEDYWAGEFVDRGLVPIARSDGGGAWLIDKDGTEDSPVDYLNHTAATIGEAFPSFRDFVAALTMEYSTGE